MKEADVEVVAALNEITGRAKRSIAKRILDVLPNIEAALDAGNTHEEIFEALKKGGIETTFSTYRGSFYRARNRGSSSKTSAAPKQEATAIPPKREPALPPKHGPRGFSFQPLKPGDEKKLF